MGNAEKRLGVTASPSVVTGTSKLRILFLVTAVDADWFGGRHYLKNLLTCLDHLPGSQRPERILGLRGASQKDCEELRVLVDGAVTLPKEKAWESFLRRLLARLSLDVESRISSRIRRLTRADVIFGATHYGTGLRTPLVTWIPDLQHVHLPRFFTDREVENRLLFQRTLVRCSRLVIVNSRAVKQDCLGHLAPASDLFRPLPFLAPMDDKVFLGDPVSVCASYHLPNSFFVFPSQFWTHKNHTVIADALRIVREVHGQELFVVCTGLADDYRNRRHFSELLARIARKNVRQNLILLGVIPHADLLQIIRRSVALIHPSLCEGWSTPVEEARSLGKGMILSDIPVHREQAPPDSDFFSPDDPGMLAELLVARAASRNPGPHTRLEAEARAQLPTRIARFAEGFLEICAEAQARSTPASPRYSR